MSSAARPGSGRLTVLVADRHRLFATALAAILRDRPELNVLSVHPESGAGAVKVTLDAKPDVALLDLWLDGVTGIAAAHAIASAAPKIGVVVLAWRHRPEHVRAALVAGAAGFIAKEIATDNLVPVVHRVAAGERVVTDPDSGELVAADSSPHTGSDTGHPAPFEAFTIRELEVLGLLGAGLTVEDIANRLEITPKTAQTHITRVIEKTGTHSQLQAVAAARQHGYLP